MDNKVLSELKELKKLKPNGGKPYFKRKELQNWMLSKRQATIPEIKEAVNQLSIKTGIKSDYKSLDPQTAVNQLTLKRGIKSDYKSLDPVAAVTQLSIKNGRN